MRNISFDESSVMNEFAKIANEKGLMKVAQQPQQQGQQNPLTPVMQRLNQYWGQQAQQLDYNTAVKRFNAALQQAMQNLRRQYGDHPELKRFEQEARKIPERQKAQALDKFDHGLAKSAKEPSSKNYDVTGETGEELVEEAHPGGGTRTELTHSKTDENLVETIVEEQQKDIEVAKSVPKGTYAALLNLADRLDKMGHVKAADRVDSILKKKLAVEEVSMANAFKEQVARAIQNTSGSNVWDSVVKPQLLRKWQSRSMPTLTEGFAALQDIIVPMWNTASNQGVDLSTFVTPVYRQFSPALEKEQQQLQQRRQQQQTEPQSSVKRQEIDPRKRRLWQLQNGLRKMVGLNPKRTAPFDRALAGALRKNYPEAWNIVKNKGRLSAVMRAVQKRNQAAQESKTKKEPVRERAPAPPQAPPPTRQNLTNMTARTLGLLGNKYPKLDLYGNEWQQLRQNIWENLRTGKVTPEQMAEFFDVEQMKAVRKYSPTMPGPRGVSR